MDTTTIEVKVGTWQELNQQKRPGDSFDDVIQRLLAEEREPSEPSSAEARPRARADAVALGDDIPQTVDLEDARAVVQAALAVIDATGPVEHSEIVAELGEDHSLGYDMENRDGAWWKRIVVPGIKANGCEHKPGRGWARG
jgi:hypothetical protein